ncbi:hypothetical protein EV421DRAFT_1262951 [Armillaria borealis]|uniref:Piwi domain-containing protein n=1 Tax=Armillaria borealis TaxID=47425 RepID=A0AA39J2S5_9AGAR|nr:hypothetical protein EV421DRAFT_1262951 [Armillaria borealis]
METRARIINAPELQYASGFTQGTALPRDEDWILVDKPMSLCSWIVVIFVPPNQFSAEDAKRTITDLVQGCEAIGMQVPEKQPLFVYKNLHDNVDQSILEALTQTTNERKTALTFLVCIVPDGINADLYTAVKNCSDIKSGIACLKAGKCKDAGQQYWANVALKINAKLGGVNVIPDPKSAPIISDPRMPTIVMGADVMHPAPGSQSPSRAKTHYDPQGAPSSVVSGGLQTREETLDKHRGQYLPVHDTQSKRMYFM